MSIATSFVTALISSIVIWRLIKRKLDREYKIAFNEQAWKVYRQFAELVPRFMKLHSAISAFEEDGSFEGKVEGIFSGAYDDESAIIITLTEIEGELVLVGSIDVIKLFMAYRKCVYERDYFNENSSKIVSALICAMWEDLEDKTIFL